MMVMLEAREGWCLLARCSIINNYCSFAMAMVDEEEEKLGCFSVFLPGTELLNPTVGEQAPARRVLRKQANLISRKRGEMALLVPRHIFELPQKNDHDT